MLIPQDENKLTRHQVLAVIAIAIAFIALRIGGLLNNPQLEDHDSIAYIGHAKIFLTGILPEIWGMSPDSTPAYPVLMALFGSLVGDLELGGRLVSLLASLTMLYCLFLLTKRVSGGWAAVVAVALITFNPNYIRWSYSVLTEPLYMALVFAGITLFFKGFPRFSSVNAALVGLLFGLSFLTRLEGILFLAAIPALTLIFRVIDSQDVSRRQLLKSVITFGVIFVVLAAPQVIRVSDYMNTFSFNGRTTWSVLLNSPDNRSYAEKIYGLEFDDGITNLNYLQLHPEAQRSLVTDTGIAKMLASYSKTVLLNLEDLHDKKINPLIGLPVLIFASIGLFYLIRKRQSWDAILLTAFLLVGLAAPLLHNVAPRHIAVLGPILILLAATGIQAVTISIGHILPRMRQRKILAMMIMTAFCLTPYGLHINRILFRPDSTNREYDETAITEAARIFRARISPADSERPNVIARKGYFGHFANANTISMPYTNLAGLLRYMEINRVEYLFVESRLVQKYPFLQEIRGAADGTLQFDLLYEDTDSRGGDLVLFKRSRLKREPEFK